jgi:ABC-type transport system involved in cytochrome c biogenesis permease subunit
MGVGHAPLSNLYESLIFFAWTIALALIIARLKFSTDVIVLLGIPVVFLTMAYTFFLDPSIKPLIPALQSNWLVAHVITCFLGYAGFTVSFVARCCYFLPGSTAFGASCETDILDEIVYARSVGFPMLTVGIIARMGGLCLG